jgi:gluconolactonase
MEKDGHYEVIDARFSGLINRSAIVHKLHTGSQWAEGPAYFGGGRYLVWSDIPSNRILRYDETDGNVSTFRQPSGNSNGNTVDREGRLITCEHSGRRVSRTEHDGSITVIADRFDGKRLNSPNDVVVKSDGSIWFTDPSYGIDTDYEGDKAESEIGACYVYRVDPATGIVEAAITSMVRPNGLAFSPDERLLYVADTAGSHQGQKLADLLVFDIDGNGRPTNGRRFADKSAGGFDGFRLDTEGRLWTSAGTGVECYLSDGTLIGRIKVPEIVSNCCFGGPKRNVLYMTGTTSLYSIRLMVNGTKTY